LQADRRAEPQGSPTGLPRIPDGDDLLRIGNRLALGLATLCWFRSLCGSSLAFLRSAALPPGYDHPKAGQAVGLNTI
jgi:hypothetical protein